MKKSIYITIALVVSFYLGMFVQSKFSSNSPSQEATQVNEPLYWVAPMDPNYRRDQPGKSPMGMDLVPVYKEDDSAGAEMGPGVINIDPDVVNNLGVRTAKVSKRSLHPSIKTVGYVQYDQDQLIHIHPRVEGWIETLFVKAAGDPVTKGQPLYELYSPQLVNAQEELRLALSTQNKRLIEAAQNNLRALKFPEYAINNLIKHQKVQQTVTFYASQSGVVDNLKVREGFFVKPGTTMMSIGALDQVWVEAEVFERQVPLLKVGQPVSMRLDYLPGRDWQGVVDYIYPTLDAQTRTAKVRLRFNNQGAELKPNMFAQVTIHTESAKPALVVPREAVIRTGSMNRVVLALGKGKFKSVEVILGRNDDDYIEVLGGLIDQESVVTSAQFLLDSESSKQSDFKRLHHGDGSSDNQEKTTRAWVKATINSVMSDHRMVNLDHEPIKHWRWPAMTMDLLVINSIDFSQFRPGESLYVQLEKISGDSGYQITDTSQERPLANNQARVNGVVVSVDVQNNRVLIDRQAIEKWSRPAATVEFQPVAGMDLNDLSPGVSINFIFTVEKGEFYLNQFEFIQDNSIDKSSSRQIFEASADDTEAGQ